MDNIFNFDIIRTVLVSAIPALIAITIHELSHGFIAYKLGDNTAKEMGRLTLNPIKHIDIIGLAMIVLIGFGWAKPVPVDMSKFKHPKWGMALTALAGPVSNVLLAFIVAFIFMLIPAPYGGFNAFDTAFTQNAGELPIITLIIHRLILINVFLAVFNILPIPPLDGSKVVFSLLPEKHYFTLMRYERYGMILLLILIFSGTFLSVDIFNIIIQRPAIALLVEIANFAHNFALFFGNM